MKKTTAKEFESRGRVTTTILLKIVIVTRYLDFPGTLIFDFQVP